MIEVENVAHTYGGVKPRAALRGVSFSVQKGEFFALLGPNGGGKSTLFHILSTFFAPKQGAARIAGHDVVSDVEAVRRSIGVVFQSPALDPVLSVEENLRYYGNLFGLSGSDLSSRLTSLAEQFGVSDRMKDPIKRLSGGLKRRVELAKGLLSRPKLLLLDEPSTGLDPAARLNLRETLRGLCVKEGLTVLLTTHFMEEADACDRVAILNEGLLVALGTPSVLKSEVPPETVQKRIASQRREEATLEDVFMTKTGKTFE